MRFLTETLITSTKRRSFAPIGQNTFTEEDIIAVLNEELSLKLVADIMSVREDFFLRTKSVTVTASVPYYTVPKRAIGNSLKKVFFVSGTQRKPLARMSLDHIEGSTSLTGEPEAFILVGDEIMLYPTPSAAGSLEFWYYFRPNELVASTSVARITSITEGDTTVTFEVDTSLEASVGNNGKIDILSSVSPFLLWSEDVTAATVTSSTIIVAKSAVVNEAGTVEPQVGDYICPAGYANIPQVPEEYHPILAQMGASVLAQGLGDAQKLQMVNTTLTEMRKQAFTLVVNRVELHSEPIMNRQGLLDAVSGPTTSDWGI